MKKQTVLVTGASRGIGRAIAMEFAKQEYQMVITCVQNKEKLNEVKEEIESLGSSCLTFVGDMGDESQVAQLFELITARFGGIDILVNNAGISYIGLLTDMTSDDWNHIVTTNLTSVFNCCHKALPYMIHQKKGRIINISSVWGSVGASCEVAYSATKGAINSFTKALAKEMAPSNIQINAVACGAIDTEMNQFLSDEDRQCLMDEIPAGRFGEPEEVGQFVVQIATGPSYLTGQVIRFDGSWI